MKKQKRFFWLLFRLACSSALLLSAGSARALQISEVMYDPDGTDAGREWLEIWNDGDTSVDLEEIFLLEANTRHKIAPVVPGEPASLAAGERAILADKSDLFSVDYPSVSSVFDSAFSLSNSGERLALVSADGDEYSYAEWSASSGATAGKSWQRSGLSWVAAAATPGASNADREPSPAASGGEGGGTAASAQAAVSAHSGTGGVTTIRRELSLAADAGRTRVVPVGSELAIEPEVEGAGRASFSWSWGDGETSRGRHGRHVYRFPGTYAVVLNVRGAGGALATARTVVTALSPQVLVSVSGEGEDLAVTLENSAGHEVNLGGFSLETGGESFPLPEDTILLPNGAVAVPNSLARLPIGPGSAVFLRRPDGKVLRAP